MGDQDTFTPLRYSQVLVDKIEDASLLLLPGVGHHMFYEKTEEFNQKTMKFIQTHDG